MVCKVRQVNIVMSFITETYAVYLKIDNFTWYLCVLGTKAVQLIEFD